MTDVTLGRSKNKNDALAFVRLHSDYIFANLGTYKVIHKDLDWSLGRGQGKRIGGMIKGGMCTLMGRQRYHAVDMSGFKELADDGARGIIYGDSSRCARYAGAFNGGCNHLESMCFAVKPNLSPVEERN